MDCLDVSFSEEVVGDVGKEAVGVVTEDVVGDVADDVGGDDVQDVVGDGEGQTVLTIMYFDDRVKAPQNAYEPGHYRNPLT